jgi:Protein of unknown function DUF262/Protein of unknown function (DUF1524)
MKDGSVTTPGDAKGAAEFVSISIFDAIGRIRSQTEPLFLPAIQRHFVWKRDQICKLFDSTMRSYPIGTFLFWEVEDEKRNDYAFYEFIQDYSEHAEECNNKTAPLSLPPGLTGVLDGQQRLNSMYVALRGSYAAFLGGKGRHRANRINFPPRWLNLNLLFTPDETEDVRYQFEFLTEEEAKPEWFDEKNCWFPVHLIYHCNTVESLEKEWRKFCSKFTGGFTLPEGRTDAAIAGLRLLRTKVRDEKLITYFPVRGRDLSEALKIFIRANNGGTTVTNAEMIFSTIVAHWDVGRQKIEAFVEELNDIGNGFSFDVSALMLACLALSGSPIRLKIESFQPAYVEQIKKSWEDITGSLRSAARLFAGWGFSGNNAVNSNAIIAVALFVRRQIDLHESKDELRLFVVKSLVCELYRRHERSLNRIREYIETHVPAGAVFSCHQFESDFALPSGQKMEVSPELLEQLLMLHIHEGRTYVVLSLLHTQHAIHQHAFEKDHIHPHSGFEDLEEFKLDAERAEKWHDWKNRLSNLQLLQHGENNNKRATPFKDWVPRYRSGQHAIKVYLAENDIPEDLSLALADFELFFEKRRERLRERLAALLGVDLSQVQSAPVIGPALAGQAIAAGS